MARNSAAATAETETKPERNLSRVGGDLPQLTFIRPSKFTEADIGRNVVDGIYLGIVENNMTGKNDHKFQLEDGSQVIINGSGNLGYKLSKVPMNSVAVVKYLGKTKIAKGPMAGKLSHSFDVYLES